MTCASWRWRGWRWRSSPRPRARTATFRRKLRLDWAEEQLGRTDKPLADLSLEAGFADQSHFTRQFRARTGFTPGSYRRCVSSKKGGELPMTGLTFPARHRRQ